MKRVAVIAAGFGFGLFLTWLCLYSFSRIEGYHVIGPQGGCVDSMDGDDCSWWVVPLLIAYLLLFPILFGVLSGLAWRRWTVQKWGSWFLGLSVLTVLFHLAGYALP